MFCQLLRTVIILNVSKLSKTTENNNNREKRNKELNLVNCVRRVLGEKWHFRRKLLTPTFHSGLLEIYLKTTIREAEILISCLSKEVGKPEFDIVPYAKRATLDIICGETILLDILTYFYRISRLFF